MEELQIGFYRRKESTSVILVLDNDNKDLKGFIFNSENSRYSDGEYGDTWITDFNIIKKNFKISDLLKDKILSHPESKPYLAELKTLFDGGSPFKIKGKFLVNDDKELILIDSISTMKKINKFIEINIYGELRTIKFLDYDRLFSIITKEEL